MLHKTKSVLIKLLLALCAICCAFALAFGVAACSDDATTIESVDIVNGELVVTYSDGTTENLGTVVGADGQDGEDGEDGADGEDGEDGANGADGADGQDGEDGTGIEDADINDDGELVLTLTDGTTINVGVVKGANGADGADGEDGTDGADGVGIEDVEITAEGKIEITYTDGSSETFDFPVIENECEHEYTEIVLTPMYCGTGAEQEGVVLNVCTVCGSSYVSAIPVAHNYEERVEAATCEEDGYTHMVCTVCGEEDGETGRYDETEAIGHDFEDATPVYVAFADGNICEDGGIALYFCANGCGEFEAEVVGAQGHHITSYEVTKAPTADEAGTLSGYCSVCGEYASEIELPVLEWVTDEDGTQYYELDGYEIVSVDKTDCGTEAGEDETDAVISYTFNGMTFEIEVALPAHNHVLNGELIDEGKVYVTDDYPGMTFTDNTDTCSEEEPGTGMFICEECGDLVEVSLRNSHEVVAVDEDPETEDGVYTEPTCTTTGSWVYECPDCGEEVTVEIPETGHSYVYTATVDDEGVLTATGICEDCGDDDVIEGIEEYEVEITTDPTCTTEGEAEYTFVYGEGEEEKVYTATGTVATVPHELNGVEMTEETYPSTTEGINFSGTPCDEDTTVTGYYECDNCGGTIRVTVKDAHTEPADATIVTVDADAEEDSEDGSVITALPAEEDRDEETVYVTEATCTTGEVRVFFCTVCEEWVTVTGEPLGHSYEVDEDSVVAATSVEEGSVTLVCTVCDEEADGHTTTVDLPMLGEVDENEESVYTTKVIVEASCTTEGVTEYTYTFEVDGETFTVSFEVVTEKLAHTHGDDFDFTFPVTDEDGETETEYGAYICEKCGNIVDVTVIPAAEEGSVAED